MAANLGDRFQAMVRDEVDTAVADALTVVHADNGLRIAQLTNEIDNLRKENASNVIKCAYLKRRLNIHEDRIESLEQRIQNGVNALQAPAPSPRRACPRCGSLTHFRLCHACPHHPINDWNSERLYQHRQDMFVKSYLQNQGNMQLNGSLLPHQVDAADKFNGMSHPENLLRRGRNQTLSFYKLKNFAWAFNLASVQLQNDPNNTMNRPFASFDNENDPRQHELAFYITALSDTYNRLQEHTSIFWTAVSRETWLEMRYELNASLPNFKTIKCRYVTNQGGQCTRPDAICTFYHSEEDRLKAEALRALWSNVPQYESLPNFN